VNALAMVEVSLDYPGRPGVLRSVHLQVPPATVVVLEGRSGSGKSSLLSVAGGLEAPSSGEVSVMDEAMPFADPQACARLRARHVGLVLQHLHLLPELTIEENVALPLRLARVPKAERESRVATLLERFGLTPLAAARPGAISGGEAQRSAIARALASQPGLLLVDEPTNNLDEDNARSVVGALKEAAQLGAGVLVATHDPLVASAGHVYRMVQGRPVRGHG
jgi:putative ABC transport system ATP-binding protein